DPAPGASGNYAAAASVTDDRVVEQTEFVYSDADRVSLVTAWRRNHDETGDGPLDASMAVATFVGHFYDDANRPIRTVNFGTNQSSGIFESGGSEPTWPPAQPPDFDTTGYEDTIVTAVEYDERGLVGRVRNPEGRFTTLLYDDLGRRVAVIENHDNATLSWNDSLTPPRWEADGLDEAEPDVDRVTSFVYDGVGNVALQVAHLPDGTDEKAQVTRYNYGTSKGSASTHTDSLVAAFHLVASVQYPDESTGEPGGSDYTVSYSYNAQGELRSFTDQNGTRHVYERDTAGRVLTDTAAALGNDIDDAVRRIGVAFDGLGRVVDVLSYSDTSGSTAVNAVRFTYTPLWQVKRVYQDHAGTVTTDGGGNPTGDTVAVTYTYTNSAVPASGTGAGNFSRITSMAYPRAGSLGFDYATLGQIGSPPSIESRINRVRKLTVTGLTTTNSIDNLVGYGYVGLDMFALVDYTRPDVQLDRTYSGDGKRRTSGYTTQDAGVYPGWDRFGRVVRHAWVDGDLTEGTGGLPNRPPVLDHVQGYDRASNRLSRLDARPGSHWEDRDFEFAYDGLDRLLEERRGVRDGGGWSWSAGSRRWGLDALGNWGSLLTDADGDGDYEGTGDGVQTREHNGANELTALDPDGPGGVSALPFSYDKAGQMRELARSSSLTHVLTHDAWGRLVRVERDDGQATEPLLEQEYNGLHWRTVKRADTSEPPDGELDQQRLLYYSASWQLIEERIDDYEEEPDGTDRVAQVFWGVRYIDDAVLRRTDTNNDGDFVDEGDRQDYLLTDAQFSVVAVVDRAGKLQERVVYDAYGMARHVWPGDVNGDGGVDGDDLDEISDRLGESIGDTDYVPEADLNRDGQITTQDLLLALGWSGRAALAPGRVSDPDGADNSAGYCGYVHNPEAGLYTVRFRHYDPWLGRWTRRDPLGYVDGMSRYEYVGSNPTGFVDPRGSDMVRVGVDGMGFVYLLDYLRVMEGYRRAFPGMQSGLLVGQDPVGMKEHMRTYQRVLNRWGAHEASLVQRLKPFKMFATAGIGLDLLDTATNLYHGDYYAAAGDAVEVALGGGALLLAGSNPWTAAFLAGLGIGVAIGQLVDDQLGEWLLEQGFYGTGSTKQVASDEHSRVCLYLYQNYHSPRRTCAQRQNIENSWNHHGCQGSLSPQ
ncbi:MAG: RHS repeat-associated core domain-containing protein, partial [Phycisphaeraceae bacterium]|nr:RHS repeat-associated core domain-containing protein [Phycisphaeraceae bacterium]